MKYLIGILVFFAAIILAQLLALQFNAGRIFWLFADASNIILFVLIITAVIITQGGFKTFIAAINALFSKKYHISAADKEKSIRLFKLIGKSVTATAILLTVISIINIMDNLDDPRFIGPNFALAMLSIMYGAIINLVFIYPAVNILETRYNTEEKVVISEKQVIDKLMELCYRQGISPEEILDAKEIQLIKKQ